jgi:hypothetical protein
MPHPQHMGARLKARDVEFDGLLQGILSTLGRAYHRAVEISGF